MDATQTPEEWRPVVGWEGLYEVSDQGQVRSLDRIVTFPDGRSRRAPGRILKPWIMANRGGYLVVGLKHAGRQRRAFIGILVLESFVGPRPDGYACCHGDGDSGNNTAANLRWDSYSENNLDLVRHGTHGQTSKTQCPQGHEYTVKNTRIYKRPNGWTERLCRTCQRDHIKAFRDRRKASG